MTVGNRARAASPQARSHSLWPARLHRTASTTYGQPAPARAGYRTGAILFALSVLLFLIVFQIFPRYPWSMLDLHIYLWGGMAVRHGHNPYLHTYHSRPGLHFTYTPFAAGIFAVLSYLGLPLMRILTVAGSIAALVLVLWLTWGALGRKRSASRLGATLTAAALALWLEPVRQTLSFGQVNLVLMAIIVADLCLSDTRWWKGVGIGLTAGFKLTPLIFIPYLLLTRRFRAAAVASATFVLTVVICFVLMPTASQHYWIDGLFLNPNRLGNVHYVGNQSLYGALLRLLGTAAAARPYQLFADAVVGLTGLAIAAWVSRRGEEMAAILICALTGLLVSPVSWSHHWVWVAPMLLVLVDFATRPPAFVAPESWRRTCWLGAAAVTLVFSGIVWAVPSPAVQGYSMTGLEQVIGDLYVLAGLVGLGLTAALLVLTRRRDEKLPALASASAGDGSAGEEPLAPGLAAQP
jgi:alpha-1,2-mannosyltransferase